MIAFKNNNVWQKALGKTLILDKLNIVSLKLLFIVDMRLSET